jgi:dipeptide transport system ATP-binding protein
VGESGCGKSVTAMSIIRLISPPGRIAGGRIVLHGGPHAGKTHDDLVLSELPEARLRAIRGGRISMIFQEPMTSLNPCFNVGFQITEGIRKHLGATKKESEQRAIQLLGKVGIPAPEKRLKAFPHQLSGGMSQRVMIAMMIACKPKLLIADEPTTALDVTIQAQILDLLKELQQSENMGLVLITHDMAVVAETAHRVIVQYAGQQVEQANVEVLFSKPRHPYAHALLNALPDRAHGKRLTSIPGVVPGQNDRPQGCLFNPRCPKMQEQCRQQLPPFENNVRCFFPVTDAEQKIL